jgi:hypothetical protein
MITASNTEMPQMQRSRQMATTFSVPMRTKGGKKLPMLKLRYHANASVWEAAGAFRIQAERQGWPPWERERVIQAAVCSEGFEFFERFCDATL